MLKVIYSVFLGILLAMFLGLGISTFYPAPEAPEYPSSLEYIEEPNKEDFRQEQKEYNEQYEEFQARDEVYHRNVSIIALIGSILYLLASLYFESKAKVIADGIMLGGLFSLMYSLIRGFASNNDQYVFLVVTAGIGVVLFIGYRKFIDKD